MARGITATIQAEVEKSAVAPVTLMEFQFDSGTLRFWTGLGQITWDGQTWYGSGDVIKVDRIGETARVEAVGIALQLAGVDTALLTAALTEDIQGRAVNLWLGFIGSDQVITDPMDGYIEDPLDGDITDPSGTVGELLADPVGPYQYLMNTFSLDENPANPVITLTCESYLASLERPRERRYTHEDQQIEFPGDLGLEFVASIQQKDITWGRV